MTQTFKEWLKNNYSLAERTVLNYVRVIDRFLSEYNESTPENINKFITEVTVSSTTYYAKYAFQYWLRYLGKYDHYKEVKKVKTRPRKKQGCYVPKNKMQELINNIDNTTHQYIAFIQYLTGARGGDVLRLSASDIVINDDGSVNLLMTVKGGNKHTVFLPLKYSFTIAQYIKTVQKKYPFLEYSSDTFRKTVDTNYRYYYESIKKSAAQCGIPEFRPHDFRRNFLEEVFESSGNIRVAQNLAGHKDMEYTLKYIKSRENDKKLRKEIEKIRG
jgi:integrase